MKKLYKLFKKTIRQKDRFLVSCSLIFKNPSLLLALSSYVLLKRPRPKIFSLCFSLFDFDFEFFFPLVPQAACILISYKGGATALTVSTKLRPHRSLPRQKAYTENADSASRETLEGYYDSGSPRLFSVL